MAYFNHAFQKTFVGYNGFVTEPGTKTIDLTLGQFTFVDPKTWEVPADLDPSTTLKCPLVLVSGSIHPQDKIGKFHGGYSESVKSKTINPKYVSAFYKVDACLPQQAQITVGANQNNWDNDGPCNANSGTVVNKTFYCGENYDLRVDIKGSPALRFLTRNDYFTASAYTGCCPEDSIAPVAVNPLIVYVNWAYQLLNSPLINPFIRVQVTYSSNGGGLWNSIPMPTTDGVASKENIDALLAYVQNPSTLPANATPEDTLGGLIITGAYEDTRFGDCTFYPNDSIIAFLEPVKLYASEVDNTGDPCVFGGVCVYNQCEPLQLKGTGENVIRDLILTEGYMQQPFYTGQDLRIREITNGTDVYDAINRNTLYTRYYIQHNVPRFNNPSSTFDNDQYLLQLIVTEDTVVSGIESTAASTSTAAAGDLPAYGTITVASTAGLLPGMVVTLTGGAGTIVANAYIYEVVSTTVFTITLGSAIAPITVALNGTTSVLSATTNYNVALEGFVEAWLSNAGSGCTTLTTYACPDYCEPVDVTND
jgi:hypothetical protein